MQKATGEKIYIKKKKAASTQKRIWITDAHYGITQNLGLETR
jgi:uncharacterized membrane protein